MHQSHIVVEAINLTGLTAEKLFKRAYEFYEVRKSKAFIVERFQDYIHQDKVPTVVEDYCLELLAHRINP